MLILEEAASHTTLRSSGHQIHGAIVQRKAFTMKSTAATCTQLLSSVFQSTLLCFRTLQQRRVEPIECGPNPYSTYTNFEFLVCLLRGWAAHKKH